MTDWIKLSETRADETANITVGEVAAKDREIARLRDAADRVEQGSSNAVFNLAQNNARGMDNAEALRTFKHFSDVLTAALGKAS